MLAKKGNNKRVGGAMRGGLRTANRRENRLLRKTCGGQALVEFAMIVPLLLLFVVLTVDFGGLINAWVTVQNTTRALADYAVLSGSSAGLPAQPTNAALSALITADMSGLPNQSSSNPNVCVQANNNGTYPPPLFEMPSGACSTYPRPIPDGEQIAPGNSTNYIDVAVDITYNYTSFFTGSSFLGLPLAVLPNSIHQHTLMRVQ
jgi:Flp pilus assembly protein TadG